MFPSRKEAPADAVELFRNKSGNLPFLVNDQTQRNALYPAGGQSALDLAPEYRRQLKSDKTVQDPARLLGVHEVGIYPSRILYRIEYGVFGNLVEYYPAGFCRVESEGLREVPGNGLSLAVFIGCQPYGLCFRSRRLKFRNKTFLIVRDNIYRRKTMFNINAHLMITQVTDMTVA